MNRRPCKEAAAERERRREQKEAEARAKRVAKGVENDQKRVKCYQESEAKLEARRKKLLSEQEALEAQVVAFADKTEKELTHKARTDLIVHRFPHIQKPPSLPSVTPLATNQRLDCF